MDADNRIKAAIHGLLKRYTAMNVQEQLHLFVDFADSGVLSDRLEKLKQEEGVEKVIAHISSAHAKAVAHVAELQT